MLKIETFVFGPFQENTYLLYNAEKECCIIDPGFYFAEEKEIFFNFLQKNSLIPRLLLNTHCHLDHIFGNQAIYDTYQLMPHFHSLEQPMMDFAPQAAIRWQLDFNGYSGSVNYINPGETLHILGIETEIRFTPGHSPGSLSFYLENEGLVFSGDALFSSSIGRTDLQGGDYKTLINAIQTQLFTLPDDTKVYSGHGDVTTIGFEKMNNPYVKLY